MSWEAADFSHLKINDIIYSHIHNPKKILNFYKQGELENSYTIKDIHDEIQAKKKVLKSSLHVQELVFISWEFGYEFITLFLALLEIEVIPVPVLSIKELEGDGYINYLTEFKNKTGISKIIVPKKFKEELVINGFEVVILETEKDFFNSRNNPQKPFLYQSEKSRKIAHIQFPLLDRGYDLNSVIFSHESILKSVLKLKEELLLSEDQKCLSVVDYRDDFFIIAMIIMPLIIGMEQHFYSCEGDNFNAEKWLRKSSQINAHNWIANAKVYEKLAKLSELTRSEEINLSSLRISLCAPRNLNLELYDTLKYELNKYSWNEESFKTFYSPLCNHFITSVTQQKFHYDKINNRKIPCLGRPLKGSYFRVVDENNYPLGEDQEGYISIKSNTFALSILNFEKRTEVFFDEHVWYRTDDIGFLSHGELFVTGHSGLMVSFKDKLLSKTHLIKKLEDIVFDYSEVKRILLESVINKKGLEDVFVILVIDFNFRWFLPFWKKKLSSKINEKLKIKKENIVFINSRKLPLTTEGKIKPLSLKRDLMQIISNR